MSKTEVGIIFKAYDQASREMAKIGNASGQLQRTLNKFTIAGKIGLASAAIYALGRGISNLVETYAEQERAEKSLAASLRTTNDLRDGAVDYLKDQAEAMADLTRFTDQDILSQMAIAHNMGLSTDQLVEGAKAAIGLAAAYDKDLGQAMRVVTMASQGETKGFKELGIVLDDNLSAADKYNEILRRGQRGWDIAIADSESLGGSLERLSKEWNETKEALIKPFTPAIIAAARGIREAMDSISKSFSPPAMMTPEIRAMAQEEYRQTVGSLDPNAFRLTEREFGEFEEQRPKYWEKYQQILENNLLAQSTPQTSQIGQGLTGTDGGSMLSTLTPMQEQAREQVTKLNDALAQQLKATQSLDRELAENVKILEFKKQLEIGYAGQADAQNLLLSDYIAKLNEQNRIEEEIAQGEFNQSIQQRIESLQFETSLIGMSTRERGKAVTIEEALNEAREKGVKFLNEQQEQLEAAIDAYNQAKEAAEKLNEEVEKIGTGGDQMTHLMTDAIDGLADALARAVVYSEDLGKSLEEWSKQLAFDWLKMFLSNLMKMPFLGMAGGGGGGFGMGHTGGVVGSDTFGTRSVSPSVFADAPRAHQGLLPGERPMIVRDDEGIFTPGQMKALGMTARGSGFGMGHTGGVVGSDTFGTRSVSPSVFADAPRAHQGLLPGERPMIVRDDEGIFTPGQMEALGMKATGGGALSTRKTERLLEHILNALQDPQNRQVAVVERTDYESMGRHAALRRGRG